MCHRGETTLDWGYLHGDPFNWVRGGRARADGGVIDTRRRFLDLHSLVPKLFLFFFLFRAHFFFW